MASRTPVFIPPAAVLQRRGTVVTPPVAAALPRQGAIVQRAVSHADSDRNKQLATIPREPSLKLPAPTGMLFHIDGPDLSDFSDRHERLTAAHHIFPKSGLGWLYNHMTESQRVRVRRALFMTMNAGPLSLARLTSNLISPHTAVGRRRVLSDKRSDDPHHNRARKAFFEQGLDLVRTDDGGMDPRSMAYFMLAQYVSRVIWPAFCASNRNDAFKLTDQEAAYVLKLVQIAEMIHYHVEAEPRNPSHSRGIFQDHPDGAYKGRVPRLTLPSGATLNKEYRVKKREEAIVKRQERALKNQTLGERLKDDVDEAETPKQRKRALRAYISRYGLAGYSMG